MPAVATRPKPSSASRRATGSRASPLSRSWTERNARPAAAAGGRRAIQALAKAPPNSALMPITSPVDFISGPSSGSTPGKRRNGKTGALTKTAGTAGSSVKPTSARLCPAITRQAIATSGTPTALAMNGTVREARGFTSST